MVERPTSHPDQVTHLFDAKAATWAAKYAPDGRLADRLARLGAAVQYYVRPPGQVLDLGCGTGELACFIATAGLRTKACDISEQMLLHAVALDSSGAVDWVQLEPGWESLPFATDCFDAIVASSVLEYIGDPAVVLRECARILRPGGVVLFTVPDPRHPIRWLEWLVALTTRVPLARVAGYRYPRLERYLIYLRISRQRHSAKWWRAVAARTGLLTLPNPDCAAVYSPLRLFAFKRHNEKGVSS